MRNQKPRVSTLAGTLLAVLLLGAQVVNGATAAAIPLPPGGPGVPVTKLHHVNPTQLKAGAPLWPWLITAAVGIVFITLLVVENVARSRRRSPGHRHQKPFLHDGPRPSATR